MEKIDAYKRIIDLINLEDMDFKGICIEIAKTCPVEFVQAYENVKNPPPTPGCAYGVKITGETSVPLKINAIKAIRMLTGADLRDSKDTIEALKPISVWTKNYADSVALKNQLIDSGYICELIRG